MRKAQKKAFYAKVTVYFAQKIQEFKNDGWLDVELAKKLGVHPSRLSEIRNYEKHKVPINEKVLASFIGGGVVTVAELKKNIPELSEDEMNELHEKNFYGDSEVKKRFASLSRKGVDVAAYLIKLDEET
ncbi:MAG: hypothetical protein JEZ12_12980 [Desulfobacterium sp.]|nr:hypothetical protein [Desulfobacterium sp.]